MTEILTTTTQKQQQQQNNNIKTYANKILGLFQFVY